MFSAASMSKNTIRCDTVTSQTHGNVVVIGNGPSVLEYRLGSVIDQFAEVVRFNEYQLQGFETHVGSRVTLWVTSAGHCAELLSAYPERVSPVLVAIPYRRSATCTYQALRHTVARRLSPQQLQRVSFVKESIARRLMVQHAFNGTAPSSGLTAIWHLLQIYHTVYLHGFDFFTQMGMRSMHYFSDDRYGKALHKGGLEKQIIESLLKAGRVQFVAHCNTGNLSNSPITANRTIAISHEADLRINRSAYLWSSRWNCVP
mmetsp:Transcript_96/g.212  ORF Transcript_96/g.212 Transcript_96/m.212 type:complete len:259 (+) Transcript_96:121-897(+)